MKTRILLFATFALILAACSPATPAPQPTPTAMPSRTPVVLTDPAQARDLGIAYLLAHRQVAPDQADPTSWDWVAENVTPEDIVDAAAMQYTASDWVVVVIYPMAGPQLVPYKVTVNNVALGLHWEGEISPERKITEIMFVQDK